MKWAMLMFKIDEVSRGVLDDINNDYYCSNNNLNLGKYGHTKRPNGGEWDLLGMEEYNGERPNFVGQHGGGVGCPENEDKKE